MMELKRVYEFPHEILLEEAKNSVSIYMSTNVEPGNFKQDGIRIKNLISKVEDSLSENLSRNEIKEFLDPIYKMVENPYFWEEVSLGLAILLNENGGVYYILNRYLDEYAGVSNEFYIKPLIRNFQSYDKFNILELSRDEFKLYEGTRYGIEEVKLPKDTITKKDDLIDESSVRGKITNFTGAGTATVFHGLNPKDKGVENVTDTFYRYVDEFVNTNYSKKNMKPLILFALTENQGFFRNLSKNQYLLEKGIEKSPTSVSMKDLQSEFWKVIEPIYLKKTEDLILRFNDARGQVRGGIDELEIIHQCKNGRVETLIVEADRLIPKHYNEKEDCFIEENIDKYYIGDLINQIAIMAIKQKASVVVLPKEKMPSDTGLAAIYRF